MKNLVLDFLRRWRWLFVLALIVPVASGVAGYPFVFVPAALVALMLDAQRGVFRAVRPIPVSMGDQAKAWWFVGVPLLPLLSVPLLVVGVLVYQLTHRPSPTPYTFARPIAAPAEAVPSPPSPTPTGAPVAERRIITAIPAPVRTSAPWFVAGVQVWVAMGYAGFCFLLMQWAPTRPPENIAENLQQGAFGLLWGLSIPGVMFLLPALPQLPAAVAPWHWAIFAVAPVCVALSYLGAGDVVQRRMFAVAAKPARRADSRAETASSGLTGVPLYLANFAGRTVLILIGMAAVQSAVMRWILGPIIPAHSPGTSPPVMMQIVMMGLIIGALMTEAVGLRGLRALPLSAPRLAALLSSISWAAALAGAAFSALWCRFGDPALPAAWNFAAQSLAMCGWATLALAATLRISSSGRLAIMTASVMIPAVGISFFATHPGTLAASGVVFGAFGFALLVRGIRKSSAFYRPRGFFGMMPGQPSAVR